MSKTRYSEARTLVRGLSRCAGQSGKEFKEKLALLRRRFRQFNVDVSELCQWLMALRPEGKRGSAATKCFWEFFLEPEDFLDEDEKANADGYRRMALDVAAGIAPEELMRKRAYPEGLGGAIASVRKGALTESARKLFARLSALGASQRQVLAKAAAEWIVGRYQRAYENRERQREEWEKEKRRWESNHPELSEAVREEFNEIFKGLEIRIKKPHVCSWERLKEGKSDCEWAGERFRVGHKWQSHAALCAKYRKFRDGYGRGSRNKGAFKKFFVENAKAYLELRINTSSGKEAAMAGLLQQKPAARWFPEVWEAYLKALEVNEETLMGCGGELPHCVVFGGDKECGHNTHTEKCQEYAKALRERP